MILARIKKGHTEVALEGSLAELQADTLALIEGIYRGIEEKNEEAAKRFKEVILNDINLAFMTADEIVEERGAELLKGLLSCLREMEEDDEDIDIKS